MERIKLTLPEKKVLKELKVGRLNVPNGVNTFDFIEAVRSLTEKRLIVSRINYDEIIDMKLTSKGQAYIINNPSLRNPIDWKWIITTTLTAITAIATTIALFIACSKF